ncbi:helix-hairpin-helix domain-containing protein [Paucibacter sp. DJ1R-11]|uniref:ComEA family DNA-binding protein n=1 Tax=Paucibacter sp. DJ1R-11 TaxID=2893556 RepID=UPI0021E36C9F|nr:helix-hairpin-helix domain-containing protein [Paucibacter sp. DJ1R-11]MCV2365589.1 helix-hairpin-helix domain-containing protein [Paucibacter sp. DJ1R-11]
MATSVATTAETTTLEINTASRAQLESLRGLGPALVERLLLARQQGRFSDWAQLRRRVRGVGPTLAQQLSAQGLRVAGKAWAAESAPGPTVSSPTQTD